MFPPYFPPNMWCACIFVQLVVNRMSLYTLRAALYRRVSPDIKWEMYATLTAKVCAGIVREYGICTAEYKFNPFAFALFLPRACFDVHVYSL